MRANRGLHGRRKRKTHSVTSLNQNTTVTIGAAAAVIATLLALAWGQSGWQTSVDMRLQNAMEQIDKIDDKLVGKSANGWHKPNQRSWARELQAANPDLVVPTPRNEFDE